MAGVAYGRRSERGVGCVYTGWESCSVGTAPLEENRTAGTGRSKFGNSRTEARKCGVTAGPWGGTPRMAAWCGATMVMRRTMVMRSATSDRGRQDRLPLQTAQRLSSTVELGQHNPGPPACPRAGLPKGEAMLLLRLLSPQSSNASFSPGDSFSSSGSGTGSE